MNLKDAFWNEGKLFDCSLPTVKYRQFNDDMESDSSVSIMSAIDVEACIEKYGAEIYVTCDGSAWYFVSANIVTSNESQVRETKKYDGIKVETVAPKIDFGTGERFIDIVTESGKTFTIHWCHWLRRGNWQS